LMFATALGSPTKPDPAVTRSNSIVSRKRTGRAR
jgi:hypothetical protein